MLLRSKTIDIIILMLITRLRKNSIINAVNITGGSRFRVDELFYWLDNVNLIYFLENGCWILTKKMEFEELVAYRMGAVRRIYLPIVACVEHKLIRMHNSRLLRNNFHLWQREILHLVVCVTQ